MRRTPNEHPTPIPFQKKEACNSSWKRIPASPKVLIRNDDAKIVISWNINKLYEQATIVAYQIYAYQETSTPPTTSKWRHVSTIRTMKLTMAATFNTIQRGYRYHFAVRAIDEHSRYGKFSQASICM